MWLIFNPYVAFGEDLKKGYCPWLLPDSTLPRLDPPPTQSEARNSLRPAVSGNTNRLYADIPMYWRRKKRYEYDMNSV